MYPSLDDSSPKRLFCSTIIPTVGRASLRRAVESVLNQQFDSQTFEVIVVNDSGKPLEPEMWQMHPQVQIVHTNRMERSYARNAGAAVAQGTYLHFLDDDDWLAPHAFAIFCRLAQTSHAGWLYGAACLIDANRHVQETLLLGEQGNCLAHVVGGEWVPLQASLIRATEFNLIGGFSLAAVPGEDRDLCGRYALIGDFSFVHDTVAYLDRSSESTTNYHLSLAHSRREREKILDDSHFVERVCTSTTAGYWRGRAARVLLASALTNLRQGHPRTAGSRMLAANGCIRDLSTELVHKGFWQGVTSSHQSHIVASQIIPELQNE
jgi:glycosyltransferase involved in cell wall biosynthesis